MSNRLTKDTEPRLSATQSETDWKQMFSDEFERRWRARVGTMNPYDVDPYARVGRNEMADWCKDQGIDVDLLTDAAAVQKVIECIFKRLKREFPNERW